MSFKPPTVAAASGSGSSTTSSAISGGTIVIRDEAGQQALTGKTAAETIASLNRDTSDTLNALKPIFDKEKIEAGFEIVSEASRQTGQFLANRAEEKKVAERALADAIKTGNTGDASNMKALMDRVQSAQDWSAEGKYGLVLLAVTGAASANVTGSTSAFVQSAAVNYLQGLGAAQVKKISDSLGTGSQAEVARAALHGIVGCAGAAGQGAACASGALGASAGSILNSLMGTPEGLDPEQIEARRNLVTSLVAGIATAAGAEAATASNAAALETSRNWGYVVAPVAAAVASRCATNATCQRVTTQIVDKTVYVAVQMKDGAVYVGSAALVGISAASDTVGTWASEFVDYVTGRDKALPGKPGDVVHVVTPPPLPAEKQVFGSEIPVWPSEPIQTGGTPGYEADPGKHGGGSVTPLPDVKGPDLILNEASGDSTGEAGRKIGLERELRVAQLVQGSRSGEKVVVAGMGSTDIDVVANNGDLVAVGGAAKASNLGKLGQELRIYKEVAQQRGVAAKAYFFEGTPDSVIKLASKILGYENVKSFTKE